MKSISDYSCHKCAEVLLDLREIGDMFDTLVLTTVPELKGTRTTFSLLIKKPLHGIGYIGSMIQIMLKNMYNTIQIGLN